MADRIYIRGFPSEYTYDELKQIFREFGRIKSGYIVNLPPDPYYGIIERVMKRRVMKRRVKRRAYPTNYGIIRYFNANNAEKAIKAMHRKESQGGKWFVAQCDKKQDREKKYEASKL